MHIVNISVIQGDMEIETDLNGTMKVKKASTKPSKISISYSPEDDGKIPYKNYDMVVTDKLIKGGVLQDGGRTVIKECIAIMPKEGLYTQDLNQVLYFRNDSNWYMKSVLDPNTKAWPELKREKLSCKTYQKQDVLMVSLRYIINGLENSKLEMKGKKLSASFTMNNERQSLNLEIGKKEFELNGEKKEARVVPEIKQGMTFVSIEDIAKALGAEVRPGPETHSLYIVFPRQQKNQEWLIMGRPNEVYRHNEEGVVKIVIGESETQKLRKGEIIIKLDPKIVESGIKLGDSLPQIQVKEGDIQLGAPKREQDEPNRICIPVLQVSTEPSYIEIQDIKFKVVSRTLEEKQYPISIGGSAVGEEVFLSIMNTCTPNTQSS